MNNDGYHIGTVTFTGWKGVVAIIVVCLVIAGTVVNLREMPTEDKALIEAVKSNIRTRCYRELTGSVKKHMDSGNIKQAAKSGAKIASAKVNIESIKIAYPAIGHFFRGKDVVAKVTYNVTVGGKVGETKTGYFEVEHMVLDDSWYCYQEVSIFSYYINLGDDD